MKKIITIISVIALSGCDGGWQKLIDDRDEKILLLTKENNQLQNSFISFRMKQSEDSATIERYDHALYIVNEELDRYKDSVEYLKSK